MVLKLYINNKPKYKMMLNNKNIVILLGTTIFLKEYVGILLIENIEYTSLLVVNLIDEIPNRSKKECNKERYEKNKIRIVHPCHLVGLNCGHLEIQRNASKQIPFP